MPPAQKQPKEIFLEAVERFAPDQWPGFLDQVCLNDPDLRNRVKCLLEAHISDESLLDSAAEVTCSRVDHVELEQPGSHIGPYKILHRIGEGGMGVVYMAEQEQPVRRRVALKIVKPGMDTTPSHRAIRSRTSGIGNDGPSEYCTVFDAGATDSGRPYFVMELVNGISATKYCDQQHLTPRERLELFIPVCLAVHDAHQKGIIHRDLKPSNILIALYDGRPVPKIIDFGVAKAAFQNLTEKTMFTQLGQIVGTLEYMSPEQAERNQLDIDTRSDVYSLGVVLYELLTGDTPIPRQRLRTAALDEMLRIIREEEPQRPSIRLGSSVELNAIAACRHVEPQKLTGIVRGELDWIVMKALEKDRGRRYDTARLFADDIRHYLDNESVVACPPSKAYRFRKFARRNRVTLVTLGVVAASLIVGLFGTAWQAYRATRAEAHALIEAENATQERDLALAAERRAESERANVRGALKYLAEVLEQAAPYREPDRELKVRTLLDRATARLETNNGMPPLVEAPIRQTVGRVYWGLGEFALAESQLTRAYALHRKHAGVDHSDSLNTAYDLGMLYWIQSDFDKAEPLFEEVVGGKTRLLGADHPETLRAVNGLGLIYLFRDELSRAEQLYVTTLGKTPPSSGDKGRDALRLLVMRGLALTHIQQERFEVSEALLNQVLEAQLVAVGNQHPETLITRAMLATLFVSTHRLEEAEPLAVEAFEIRRKVFGELNPHTLSSMGVLSRIYVAQERHADAEPLLRTILEQARSQSGRLPPFTIWEIGDVGLAHA